MKQTNLFTLLLIAICHGHLSAQNLSGKIIFSFQNTTPDRDSICVIDPDGSNFQYITQGSFPRGSAAGSYLSFLRGADTNRSLNHIYFRDASNSEYEYYNNGSKQPIVNYDFSPAETTCIYDWQAGFYNQLSANPNGQNVNNGSGAGDLYDCYPRISPIDSDIVFHNINHGLYLMPFAGVGNAPMIPNTQPGDLSPCWSADGQWIYYGVQSGANTDVLKNIYRIHKDGSGKMQVTALGSTDTIGTGLVATKNGKFIVAPARINGVIGLYKFRTDSTFPQTTAYLIKAFPNVSSVNRLLLGNADSVTNIAIGTGMLNPVLPKASLWPNPAGNTLWLTLGDAGWHTIKCFDINGRALTECLSSGTQSFDISTWPVGNYYAEIADLQRQQKQVIAFSKQR